ncbi:uncharacterized protein LOC125549498 [Triticum urartu]|uniref:uncharacterized protein LOC125549498 n=1 Tax=Triticum urartu TaxID=4572 RepID=UPI00204325E9|nr:uncharacterized protein LOC125549498 [Triticum urartu]XP_048568861.1 uncharacterized protein LOC125549498 [Triticum urartu]
MAAQKTSIASMEEEGDAEGVVVKKSKASCWTRRVRIGNAPEERDANPSRVPALEASIRAYADNKVMTKMRWPLPYTRLCRWRIRRGLGFFRTRGRNWCAVSFTGEMRHRRSGRGRDLYLRSYSELRH